MLAILAGILLASGATARATGAWVGNTSGAWATAANWGSSTLPATGTTLSFGAAGTAGAALTDNLMTPSTYTLAGITFSSAAPAYTINQGTSGSGTSGSGFTLAGSVTNSSANLQTINDQIVLSGTTDAIAATSGNITLGGILSGTGTLKFNGTGNTITLSGANTNSGAMTIQTGTLSLGAAGADSAASITLSGTTGAGSLTETVANGLSGTASISIGSGDSAALGFSNSNTGTSVFNSTGGTLTIGNNGSLGTGALTFDQGTLLASTALSGVTAKLTIQGSGSGTAVVGGSSSIVFSGVIVATSGGARTLTVNNTALTSFTGGTFTDQQSLALDGTGNVTIGDVVTGAGSLTYSGTGTLTFSGANTFSGGTTLNSGTLTVTGAGATLGAASGTLAVNNTNTGAGTDVVLNLSTTAPTTTGSLSGTIAAPSSSTNTATINNGGQTYTVNQTTAGTYTGVIAGTGGFALGTASTNTLTLAGANTYTGATTVNAGTLALTGSLTSAVTVNSGGAFTGIGTTTGAVTLNSGGNITPGTAGTSTGILTASSLTFNSGGALTYTLSSTDNTTNKLNLTGALTLGAGGTYNINLSGGVVGTTYELIDTGATPTFTAATFAAVGDTGTFSVVGNDLDFTVNSLAVVPEPRTGVTVGIFALALLCLPRIRSSWKRCRRA